MLCVLRALCSGYISDSSLFFAVLCYLLSITAGRRTKGTKEACKMTFLFGIHKDWQKNKCFGVILSVVIIYIEYWIIDRCTAETQVGELHDD